MILAVWKDGVTRARPGRSRTGTKTFIAEFKTDISDGAEPKTLKTRYETAPQILKKIFELTNTPLPARLTSGTRTSLSSDLISEDGDLKPALLDAPEDIRRVVGGEGNERAAQAQV